MSSRGTNKSVLIAGLVIAFLLAGFVSGFASSKPDGLEKVAGDKGIAVNERRHGLAGSPLADYTVKGIDNERLAGGLAGVIGVTIVLVAGTAVFAGATRLGRGSPPRGSRAGTGAPASSGSGV